MRYYLAIDLRYVETPNSGLSRFSMNIFLNLIKNLNGENIDFLLLFPPLNNSNHLNEFLKLESSNIQIIYARKKRGIRWKFSFIIFDLSLFLLLRKYKIDIFLSPYIDPPILPGIKIISTIHDIIFLQVDDYFNNFRYIKRLISEIRIFLTILYSDYILTVSKATKLVVKKRYYSIPFFRRKLNNISVIPNGVNIFRRNNNEGSERFSNIESKYILYVGDRRNHKNLYYTIRLIDQINKKYNENIVFVIAGSKSYKNYKLQKLISSMSFVLEVINPSDSELDNLYNNCLLTILLSKDEGFGIPIIEASSRSKKVVISNIPALLEVAPESALVLDLQNTSDHIKMLHNYLKKEVEVNAQLIFKKWSWHFSSIKLKELLLFLINN